LIQFVHKSLRSMAVLLVYDSLVFYVFQDAVGCADAYSQSFGLQGCVHFRIRCEKDEGFFFSFFLRSAHLLQGLCVK
jgi:hypothetical protein